MYCVNCGSEVEEGQSFCTQCGKKLIEFDTTEKQTEISESEEKMINEEPEKNEPLAVEIDKQEQSEERDVVITEAESGERRKIGITIALVLGVLLAVTGIFYLLYQDKLRWDKWVSDYENTMNSYYLSDDEKEDYEDYLTKAKEARKEEERTQLKTDMERLQKTVKTENDAYIQEIDANIQKINQEYDLSYALDEEVAAVEESKKKIDTLKSEHAYPDAIVETEHCLELEEDATRIREGWNLSIQQKDVSAYPTVKLYFTVEDENGNAVENLDKNMFFLSQKQAEDSTYLKHEIVNATQLNENESLNINLVADVSGSMCDYMSATKQVMNNFLNTVQFGVGDQVGLMAFDDISYRLSDFTGDKSSLSSSINNMTEGGLTKLYDTLIEAVQTVLPQSGAKCVIAFTDGYDNRSASSVEDVIDYANMYDIPIFIIGIGDDVETSVLRNIAESTGGFYKSVDYVDSSFEDIYSEIYRVQKEVYCLEYVVDSDDMNQQQDISIYVRNTEYGGTTSLQYTASYDYFSILLQQYLTSYLDALEAGDYSVMEKAGFMSADGGIAKEMKAYIKKNQDTLTEQLLSSEVTDIKYVDKDTYVIKTEEIYDIQQERNFMKHIKGSKQDDDKEAIRYMENEGYDMEYLEEEDLDVSIHKTRTLKGHFVIKRNEAGKWQFADYKSNYKVLDSEVYTAYPLNY